MRPARRTRRTMRPKDWIAKYKGQFDQGWDKVREETLAAADQLGIIPAGTQLTARPEQIPAWDSLERRSKRLYARMMEVYAGHCHMRTTISAASSTNWSVGPT